MGFGRHSGILIYHRNNTHGAVAHRICSDLSGFIETPMTDVVPVKVAAGLKRQIPLARFGQPSEIAQVALFLASPQSSYVTGAVIEATGGLAM